MKKYFKFLVGCLTFIFFSVITVVCLVNKENRKDLSADSKYTEVVTDSGTVVKYRGSNESVLRLKEYNYPTQNLRACWASLFVGSMSSYSTEAKWKEEFNALLDNMEEHGLNCLIFHVRTHNNAFYKSKLSPLATYMKGVDFDTFDPIAWAIEATHNRGIEFHAWLNPYRVNDNFCAEDYPAVNPASNPANILVSGSSKILDPGLPVVQKFLVDTCMEVVENYDIDAIHFDDYFYISGVDDSATRAKYNPKGLSLGNWRREQVDIFIESLSKAIRSYNETTNKCVQLGISPSGIYQNGGYSTTPKYNSNGDLISPLYSNTAGFAHYDNYLYSDTLNWINKEWIDYIMPQTYWAIEHTGASFADLSRWWSWAVKNKKVNLYLGIGFYMATESTSSGRYWQMNKNEIRDQILNAAMYEEIGGISFYSYNYINSTNTVIKNGMQLIKNDYFKKSIPGDVKQYYADKISTINPTGIKVENNLLTYDKLNNVRGYMIYKTIKGLKLDVNDIDSVYYYGTKTSITLENTKVYDYYIATVNYANVISTPINISTEENNAALVVEKINDIPTPVRLEDEDLILSIDTLYNRLTESEKKKVTNYEKFVGIKKLFNEKKSLYKQIVEKAPLTNYDETNKILVENLLQKYHDKINNLVGVNNTILDDFLNELSNIKSIADILKENKELYSTKFKEEFAKLELEYYKAEVLNNLNKYYEDVLKQIEESKTTDEVISLYQTAIRNFSNFESFKEDYFEKLASLSSNLTKYLNSVYSDKSLLKYKIQLDAKLSSLVEEAGLMSKEKFVTNAATILNEDLLVLDKEVKKYKSLIQKINEALAEIEETSAKTQDVIDLKTEYSKKIEEANSEEEVKNLLTEFNNKLPKKKCFSKSMIVLELLAVLSLMFVIKRKH